MNATITAQSPPYIRHNVTGRIYQVAGLAPIGLDVFLECYAVDGSYRLIDQRDARPAAEADWQKESDR